MSTRVFFRSSVIPRELLKATLKMEIGKDGWKLFDENAEPCKFSLRKKRKFAWKASVKSWLISHQLECPPSTTVQPRLLLFCLLLLVLPVTTTSVSSGSMTSSASTDGIVGRDCMDGKDMMESVSHVSWTFWVPSWRLVQKVTILSNYHIPRNLNFDEKSR